MSDNPFEEDSDRTVIRPVPGGRKPAAAPAATPVGGFGASAPPPQPTAPAYAAPAMVADGAEQITLGGNTLTAAAAPLLQLLARLRNTLNQPDPADLRERATRELRAFEQAARDAGVPIEQLRPAHYALCASLDDVVLNTPWGSTGVWDSRSLVSTFHQEVRSGERFFDLLGQLKQNPGSYLSVLELMYLCLSLGFMGRYRLSPRGPGELEKLREDLYAIIMRQRQAAEPALSPHWEGAAAPYRPARASLPVWVAAVLGVAVVAGLFVWFSGSLNAASDDLLARMMAAPPTQMPQITRAVAVVPPPPPPAPPGPTFIDKLRQFLKPEIDAGLVVVLGTDQTPIVRIRNKGLFGSGSAVVQSQFVPLLERIGTALKTEPGQVTVIGHTDNQPIHTVQFPSNFQLSTARAEAAKAIIARALGDPGRIKAEGRADAEPVASNATPEGREANRRIEVMLQRQG
ncbi:MAG: flagellar motor protein MotB [Acetobacteraceae bacterium SCN 69-10]|nr:type IVB secretion system protein IcmH/DotU [Rhodospirillales bacterium]ODU62026.1 MAG: flagellar motor protein MotB [Acetobacteraceae bacterium SCN 69-10]OJY64099.1 MAG: flagellar motor protein MotB [Rhodospirillales bacterium 70-18]